MDLPKSNPSPKRVLIRPPQHRNQSPSPSLSSIPPPDPCPPPPPPPSSIPSPVPLNGVVVVGFIGRRNEDVSQLINRIVDANVFGSGNCDTGFWFDNGEEFKEWLKGRKISYYHEEEKGILYLQFSSSRCPVMKGVWENHMGFDSVLEEHEFGDLQGLLFMFSVCHVIVFIHEGSHFDIQILKKFRILQSAKIAMAPFVRSKITPLLPSKLNSSPTSQVSVSGVTSNRSPGKSGVILRRNGSSISLMSGLGSYTSLFPGQCTPVTLFVFLDDFSDAKPGSMSEESVETSSFNQSSSVNSSARSTLPTKGSGPVVVLSRPVSKSEGGMWKKLQSSLEAQIRFSIKKCRTLTGTETGYAGPRSGGVSSSAPLFSLDAAKAVALVDRSPNQRGYSLDFATDLVENILNGARSSDSLLLESHNQSSKKEDLHSVKEFIHRQSDILRGRGGVVANTNSGSAVGMVAVAAAAAAASAASGKTFSTPELPSLEIWLSSSQLILHGILSAKRGSMSEPEINKKKSWQRNSLPPPVDTNSSKVTDHLDTAVSILESGNGLNTKFSTLWCQRTLPVAKDVYSNDLPPCYPTSLHEAQLEKALRAFSSMVKGPAMQLYLKKLEDECTAIWSSGRQLCDAISLTGKPCMHQRHYIETADKESEDEINPHSSGFVFLHACVCGRLRRLRSDPFDFRAANVTSGCFEECDKLLSAIQLPEGSNSGPIHSSSWSLIRVGGARYYEPSKGLLQSGFCSTQKFLLEWKIYVEKSKEPTESVSTVQNIVNHGLSTDSNTKTIVDAVSERTSSAQSYPGEITNEVEFLENSPSGNIKSDNNKINFGKGVPNFTMRKPFSEVVAGSTTADSGFPPLQSKKQTSLTSDKGMKQLTGNRGEQVHEKNDNQGSQKVDSLFVANKVVNRVSSRNNNPFLQIGSNVIPVSTSSTENHKISSSLKHVTVYVGVEHECPRGHRFILTPDHLSELRSLNDMDEESHHHYSSADKLDHNVAEPSPSIKNGGHTKVHRRASGMNTTTSKPRNIGTSKEMLTNGNQHLAGVMQLSPSLEGQNSVSTVCNLMKDVEDSLQSVRLEDTGYAFSLLSRNLPVYMNCPHCRTAKNNKDPPNVKFAGTISQLQRIFLVTPAFPVLLASCPVIQFEKSCLPPSVLDREQKLQFSFGSQVILPPESFLSLRLPFVYGVQLEDGGLITLRPFEGEPELTAWITKNTILQVLSRGSNPVEK